jgi:hypothetical protein
VRRRNVDRQLRLGIGENNNVDGVPHVIRRCATNRLYTAMKTLTEVVERFGGRTKISEDKDAAA